MIQVVFALFFSHLLTDFYLQPTSWVKAKFEKKHKAWQLYIHSLLAGFLAYLFLVFQGLSELYIIIPLVSIPHFCIDLWKLNQKGNLKYFVYDQIFHIFHLITILFMLYTIELEPLYPYLIDIAIILGALLLAWFPTGILIGMATKKFRAGLDEDINQSLDGAGKMIGSLERTFIILLIVMGQFSAIGFLISAKAILRFSDHKKVKNPIRMSEYVIIGTLMSFLAGILIGYATKLLIAIF